MSRILLTDAEQTASLMAGVGLQISAVLAAPQGGVALELKHAVTGATEVVILSREVAETFQEQVTATLRCNPLDRHAGAAARLEQWRQDRAARPLVSIRCPKPDCHRGFQTQLDCDGWAECPECGEEFDPLQVVEPVRPQARTLAQHLTGLFTVFSSTGQASTEATP